MKNINDDGKNGKTFLTKGGLGKSIKSYAKFPKFHSKHNLKDNEFLEEIKPAEEAIKRCESFSCNLYDEIKCLNEASKNYKEMKFHFHSEIIRLAKLTGHPYDPGDLRDLTIEKQIRKYNEVILLIKSDIELIEKVLLEKVKQYKNKEQKPPEDKPSEIKKNILQPQSRERHTFLDKFDVFKTMVDDLASIGAIERPNNKDIEIVYNDNFERDINKCGESKLNWIKPLTWFKYFYDIFFNEFFIGKKGIGDFFVSHFLHYSEEVDKETVEKDCKGKRSYPPKKVQLLFDCLFKKLKSMHA